MEKITITYAKTDDVAQDCQTSSIDEYNLYTRRMCVSDGSLDIRWEGKYKIRLTLNS